VQVKNKLANHRHDICVLNVADMKSRDAKV